VGFFEEYCSPDARAFDVDNERGKVKVAVRV